MNENNTLLYIDEMSENMMQEGMNLKKWGILLRLSIFLGLNFEVKWENCVV